MRNLLSIPAAVIALSLLGGCSSISKLVDGFKTTPEPTSPSTAVAPAPAPRPAAAAPASTAERAGPASTGGAMGGGSMGATLAVPAGDSRVASITPPVITPSAPRDGAATLPPGTARVVYFDFDSAVIRDDARSVIEAHARVLATDRTRRMTIEGHTDERGGREYNLALGQKRAEAVQRALVVLGASEAQLEAVSLGKERPAMPGLSDEASARNRRAELKDRR
jgi:peptidoglycan-associated lipoprotein